MEQKQISREIATAVRDLVGAGLIAGVGTPIPGQMCVEAAVCFAFGLPHGDNPPCVGEAVRSFKISLNDSDWSSSKARAEGMKAIAIAQLGSNEINQVDFASRLAIRNVNVLLAQLLREIGETTAAERCENAVTLEDAESAARSASSAASSAARSARYAARSAASYAARSARYAARSAASYAASSAASSANPDHCLTLSADICLEVLMELGAPGCEYLDLLD